MLSVTLGDELGALVSANALLGDDDLGDVEVARQVKHRILERRLADGAKPACPGATSDGLMGNLHQRVILKDELDALELEHATVLLDESVSRLREDAHEVILGELARGRNDRDTTEELGDHAKLVQVLRHDLTHEIVFVLLGALGDLGGKADALQ